MHAGEYCGLPFEEGEFDNKPNPAKNSIAVYIHRERPCSTKLITPKKPMIDGHELLTSALIMTKIVYRGIL